MGNEAISVFETGDILLIEVLHHRFVREELLIQLLTDKLKVKKSQVVSNINPSVKVAVIDLLTSLPTSRKRTLHSHLIKKVVPANLPISRPFVIDWFGGDFAHWSPLFEKYSEYDFWFSTAECFLPQFQSFCIQKEFIRNNFTSTLNLISSDFNDAGIQWLRKNYRQLVTKILLECSLEQQCKKETVEKIVSSILERYS